MVNTVIGLGERANSLVMLGRSDRGAHNPTDDARAFGAAFAALAGVSQLDDYSRRRNFQQTPEPAAGPSPRRHEAGRFVVQAHAARRLHYDFRLEYDGVLLSWAVPKGPSLDPSERRLAMRTEDHPLDYAQFEGVIPQGQYGAGAVMVWDEGTWEPEGDVAQALSKGRLKFTLHGHKLSGRWNLVRTREQDQKSSTREKRQSWLLIKSRDGSAREEGGEVVERAPRSVLSGRSIEGVRTGPAQVWQSKAAIERRNAELHPENATGARQSRISSDGALDGFLPDTPQLATLVTEPPAGEDYLHEVKFDGYRLLVELRGSRVRMLTRRGNDWSSKLPTLVKGFASLQLDDAVLDGEAVMLNKGGGSDFQALQNAFSTGNERKIQFYAFDLLRLAGYDLQRTPLVERKALLERLLKVPTATSQRIHYSDHVVGNGRAFFDNACQMALEGIISKRARSQYRPGRNRDWLKCKCQKRQEVVIVGYTDPRGSRSGFGALLVALSDTNNTLRFVGKVGTGFNEQSLRDLHARLSKLERSDPACTDAPKGAAARGVHWVEPRLLCEVEFSEMTAEGKLRHPSFKGLREDKAPEHVVLEQPTQPEPAPQQFQLSNPARILYPESEIRKRDLAAYYYAVAPVILPHISRRLLTLVRCPRGHAAPCFFQKHRKEGMPPAIRPFTQKPSSDETEAYVYVEDVAGLVALTQIGVLEIHIWGSHIDRPEQPDQLVFDLDPDPSLPWVRLVEGALDVRQALLELGLQSFVKTTGGKGLHVVVPISRSIDWPQAKAFCQALALHLAKLHPKKYVAKMAKEQRTGRIFIDYLRNAEGATAVAPYSTRARPGAPVATPVAWQELERDLRGELHLPAVLARVQAQGRDPWSGFFELEQKVTAAAQRQLRVS